MNVFFNLVQESYISFAVVFLCIAVGFLALRMIDRKEVGPGYWALGFLFNGLGFVLWSGSIGMPPVRYYLVGEFFHIIGFICLVTGAYRFSGYRHRPWNLVGLVAFMAGWITALLSLKTDILFATALLKGLRAVLFIGTGALLVLKGNKREPVGRNVAGISLILWGSYMVVFAFIKIDANLFFGFLVGFHILSAFGMVAMVMDRIRNRADANEERLQKLEGILPICSYCKKIRDGNDQWHMIEEYIEDRSKAEFSHGICPDCLKKHKPDR